MNKFMNYDFNINKIVLACFVPAGSGATVHNNRPSHGLAINIAGEKIYTFSTGEKLTVKENDIIYLPKRSNYKVSVITPGDCYAINFDFDEDITFSPFVVKPKNYTDIIKNFRNANRIWEMKKNSYALKCKAELYNIIYSIHQYYHYKYLPKNKYEIIRPGVDYIHENYSTQPINIEELSKGCNISSEYFRKIFKNFYGTSPVNYINNLKITRAKELLQSQLYSVHDVCFLSGFQDESHFSREFKKKIGFCPSDYREYTIDLKNKNI